MMQRCVVLFDVALAQLCEAVLLCLPKTTDGSNKELNGQQQGRRKDQQDWQAERIKKEEQEKEENWGHLPSYTANQ